MGLTEPVADDLSWTCWRLWEEVLHGAVSSKLATNGGLGIAGSMGTLVGMGCGTSRSLEGKNRAVNIAYLQGLV